MRGFFFPTIYIPNISNNNNKNINIVNDNDETMETIQCIYAILSMFGTRKFTFCSKLLRFVSFFLYLLYWTLSLIFFSFFIVKLMVRVEKKKERKDLTKRNLGPYFSYLIEQMKKKVNDKWCVAYSW